MRQNMRKNLEQMLQKERETEVTAREIAMAESGSSDIRDTQERVAYEERRVAQLVAKYKSQSGDE